MGNLFSRNQPVDAITKLRYSELKMWNFWHEAMSKAEKKSYEDAQK